MIDFRVLHLNAPIIWPAYSLDIVQGEDEPGQGLLNESRRASSSHFDEPACVPAEKEAPPVHRAFRNKKRRRLLTFCETLRPTIA
jgi:hypothetical protein